MYTLNCKGRLLVIDKPLIMGIINTTPDSFYPASRFADEADVLRQVEKMLGDGATFIDIGGQSTRPGSEQITEEEELKRVIGPLASVAREFPQAFISIDTYYARVAQESAYAGASIINDISAGRMDDKMISTVAELGLPYVLMHMKGTPQTMQQQLPSDDITKEVLDFFIHQMGLLRTAGIKDIIIDPGFGFGKSITNNFQLLNNLAVFGITGAPLLLGVSRKSTISTTLGIKRDETLNGTTVLNTMGLMNGASILRVHDVKEASEAIRLFDACRNA